MQIELTELFKESFEHIFEYIAQDKFSVARKFKKELFEQIKDIPHFPYKYRKSFYYDSEMNRDMTFKKYTIVYEIDLESNRIVILDIFNRNKPNL